MSIPDYLPSDSTLAQVSLLTRRDRHPPAERDPREDGPAPGTAARIWFLTIEHMTIQRMDHVGIVVDDLAAATEFFVELGLVLQGEGPVEGRWSPRR